MTMMTAMPVATVGRLVAERDTKLWRVLHHYVEEARSGTICRFFTRHNITLKKELARLGAGTSRCSSGPSRFYSPATIARS